MLHEQTELRLGQDDGAAACAWSISALPWVLATALSLTAAHGIRAAEALRIDVVALDARGVPVLDLRPAEFEVWINGFQIPIEAVTFVAPAVANTSRTIVVLLDDLSVNQAMIPRIRDAARRLVQQTSDADRIVVVSLDGAAMERGSDRDLALKAIDRYYVRGFPMPLDVAGEHVLKTITSISRQLAEAPGGRKAIVALGSGWLFDTPIPPPQVQRDLRSEWLDAMRATAAAHVSLYVIDPAGLGTRRVDAGTSGFARETGGLAFMNTNDVNGAIDRILTELANYYVLSVQDPPIGKKGDLRELEVKVLRRGVTPRARRAIQP
jgi:VWFA-related protein